MRFVRLAAIVGVIALAGCSQPLGNTGTTPSATPSLSDSASPSESSSASPSASPSGSASPSTDSSASPSASPSSSGSPTPVGPSTAGASTAPSATCTQVTPLRIAKIDVEGRRTTEFATIVSDGRNLTPGTREQSEFLTPGLVSPQQTAVADDPTVNAVAALIANQKHSVLVTRPDAPDTDASATRKPYSSPGTYVLYNASSPLTAAVVVLCSGQEQTWTFRAEGDPSSGVINCAVEPSKSNGLARQLYASNC